MKIRSMLTLGILAAALTVAAFAQTPQTQSQPQAKSGQTAAATCPANCPNRNADGTCNCLCRRFDRANQAGGNARFCGRGSRGRGAGRGAMARGFGRGPAWRGAATTTPAPVEAR